MGVERLTEAERWNRFWDTTGLGGKIVKAAEENCTHDNRSLLLNYLYESNFPTFIDCQLKLVSLKRDLDSLLNDITRTKE